MYIFQIGMNVSVYDRVVGSWLPGQIVEVLNDNGEVNYQVMLTRSGRIIKAKFLEVQEV